MRNEKKNKEVVLRHAQELLNDKLIRLNNEMKQLRESSASETKSSMGDKYETGRAMVMQEQAKVADQIDEITHQVARLQSIDVERIFDSAQFGAMVSTERHHFFISIPFGLIDVSGEQFFLVSSNAPIAQAMMGKKLGDKFQINNQRYKILNIV